MADKQFVCPRCGDDSVGNRVADNRLPVAEGAAATRRRRKCLACGESFTTVEEVGSNELELGANGRIEEFDAFLKTWSAASKKERQGMLPTMYRLIDLGFEQVERDGGVT